MCLMTNRGGETEWRPVDVEEEHVVEIVLAIYVQATQ